MKLILMKTSNRTDFFLSIHGLYELNKIAIPKSIFLMSYKEIINFSHLLNIQQISNFKETDLEFRFT